MPKSIIAKKEPAADFASISFNFADGRKIVCDLASLPEDMKQRCMLHGASQKIGDSYSGAESVDEAYEAASETLENLRRSIWSAGRESTGGMLAQAIANLTGKGLEEVAEMLKGQSDDAKKALRKDPQIKAEMARLSAEKAAKKAAAAGDADTADLDGLFN